MKPIPRILAASLVSAAAVVAMSAVAAPSYTLKQLDTSDCAPYQINDQGMVAGACGINAVVWKGGKRVTLGRLDKGTYAVATAINAQGVAVGDGDTGDGRPLGWANTTSKGMVNFFSNNGGNTRPIFIGDSGFVGGFYIKGFSGSQWRGAIWTVDAKDPRKSKMVDLPVLPGGINPAYSSSVPWAFNQLGGAAGYATNDVIGQHAAYWSPDATHAIVDLGGLPGSWSSLANGLNDLGQVVGESHPPFSSLPTLWENDAAHTPVALAMPGNDNNGSAHAINNLGHIIGWTGYQPDLNAWTVASTRFVVWVDRVPHDIDTVLDPVSSAGWKVVSLISINNLGQIAGLGMLNGQVTPFVLTPQ